MIYLSVIIPAYNESKRIGKTLVAVDEWLGKQDFAYEILVVDDGSKDSTVKVIQNFQTMMKNLRVIANEKNHGKGFVVRQGMQEANGEFRVFMDADNSTSVEHFAKMVPFFKEGFDVVIGSRDIKGADVRVHQSFIKETLGNMGNIFIQVVAGLWGIWDTQCGFKGFSAKASAEIFPHLTIDKWGFDVEALAVAKKKGFKIKQIPVVWINDAESHVKFSAYFEVLLETIKIRINMIKGLYK